MDGSYGGYQDNAANAAERTHRKALGRSKLDPVCAAFRLSVLTRTQNTSTMAPRSFTGCGTGVRVCKAMAAWRL